MAGRQLLVAVDLSEQSVLAAQWVMHEYYRKSDTIHLVHVARILSPQLTIHHQYHATFDIPDPKPPIDEKAFLEKLKESIREKFTAPMDALSIPHTTHLFVDTDNAPAAAVCSTLFKVADQVDANAIVMAAHGKESTGAHDPWGTYLGSVADFATNHSVRPVIVVRGYKPPLVMHVTRAHSKMAVGQA